MQCKRINIALLQLFSTLKFEPRKASKLFLSLQNTLLCVYVGGGGGIGMCTKGNKQPEAYFAHKMLPRVLAT